MCGWVVVGGGGCGGGCGCGWVGGFECKHKHLSLSVVRMYNVHVW